MHPDPTLPPRLDFDRDRLSELRARERRRREVLLRVRRETRCARRDPRGTQDRHRGVLRCDRVDRPRRTARSRVPAHRDVALLRADAGRARVPRRHRREVHRRRRDGGVRDPGRPRGRRRPGGSGGARDAGRPRRAERRPRTRVVRDAADADRRQHRPRRGRRSERGSGARHRRRGQHRRTPGAGGRARRDPDRRGDVRPGAGRDRRRPGRPARAEGEGGRRRRVPAVVGPGRGRRARAPPGLPHGRA